MNMDSVSISPNHIDALLQQTLGSPMCQRLVTQKRRGSLDTLSGMQFLYNARGDYLEEVNAWQLEKGLKTLSPHTRATRSSALKAVIGWFEQNNLRWQEATELPHMNLLHQAMRGGRNPPVAKGTWNQWMDHWCPFLKWAERKDYIDEIGFEPDDVKEKGQSAANVHALSPVEFRHFLAATTAQRMQAGCASLAGTGMRVSELAGLTISQIPDPHLPGNQGRSYCPARIVGKGNKERTIYWPVQAIKRVKHYVEQERHIAVETLIDRIRQGAVRVSDTYLYEAESPTGQRIFVQRPDAPLWLAENGDPLSYHRWGKDFRQVSSRLSGLGIRCSPHWLRHTYAIVTLSMLIKAQVKQEIIERELDGSNRSVYFFDPVREVKERLGHASIETTMVYLDHIAEHRELINMAVAELQAVYLDG
jgi:site-specific recombinase XerD